MTPAQADQLILSVRIIGCAISLHLLAIVICLLSLKKKLR